MGWAGSASVLLDHALDAEAGAGTSVLVLFGLDFALCTLVIHQAQARKPSLIARLDRGRL